MKLTRLQINRFRNIDTFSSDIGDGIVLFKGPNEAGKSSLLSAMLFGLFEDPKSSAQRLEEARRWNKESLYHLILEFKTNGETYVLEKDFENRSTLLRNVTTGEFWKDKNKVNAKLAEVIGFFSKDIFTSTACVFQDELHAISSGQKELRSLLEEKVAGKEDSAAETIAKRLEKKVLDLKRGLDRPAPANPGQIRQMMDELNRLRERREEVAGIVSKLHGARSRVNEVANELEEATKSLELKKQALEKSKLYIKANEKLETLDKALEKTVANLDRLSKADLEIDKIRSQLESKDNKLITCEANLQKHRGAVRAKVEKEALDKECQQKKDLLGRAKEIAEARDVLKKSLGDIPVFPKALVRDLVQMESDVKALERSIGERGMLLKVTLKRPIPYEIETEDGIVSAGEGAAGTTLEETAKKEIRVDFKDIAEVRVATKDRALEESLEELKEKKGLLKTRLEQYQCQSVAELVAMKELREKTQRQLEAKEGELKITLGKETMASLAKGASELEIRLEQLSKAFEEMKEFAISEEELAEREREIPSMRKEVQELEGNIRENQGILKSFSKEDLEKEKKDLARHMLVAETALDDLKAFEASGEEVVKQEDEVKTLEKKLSELKVERQTLEHILQEDRYGQEDVAEFEERIESLERRADRLRMRLRAYEIIGEVLNEARQNILKSISGEVDERIGAYFALITGGKYDRVRLSREDFSLRVFSREKGDWINPDTEELSAGAKDQLYLAARLALIDAVTGGNSIPLILDDPLVHFDALRRENTRNLLKEMSKTHQVLIFSCHDHYNDWANQIISF
ncbi:MAG: AAA family ATPase [Deltaproteobacteria bacterium]|nr:AAA family ATPase [Deltaproteobacteria bacterium]